MHNTKVFRKSIIKRSEKSENLFRYCFRPAANRTAFTPNFVPDATVKNSVS